MEREISIHKPESGCSGHEQNSVIAHEHFDKPTEMLSAEHRVIERMLDILQRLANEPPEKSLEAWKKALDFFSRFADKCHHCKEEQVLFPAMEEHGIPRDGGPIGVMLVDHEQGRSYVRSMVAALTLVERKNEVAKDSLLAVAKTYLQLLREHIEKEDEVLFRIADEVIPPDEQKALLRAFAEHEAKEVGHGVHEKYLKLVEELERSLP